MRIVRVHEFGSPQVMRVEQKDDPSPAPGEVLVRVEVAGATYAETIVRSGRFPFPLPYEPGLEVGGRVAAVGANVDSSWIDRRVVATTVGNTGGYAEFAVAEVGNVFAVPEGLELERAVPVFQAGAVAIGVLSAMRVEPRETVLVTAAAGRIGSLLVQRASAVGAHVIAAAGGSDKVAAAGDFGADITVDYDDADWADQVRAATGGAGVDVALDAIGGTIGEQAVQAAADGRGRIGIYGFTSGAWLRLDALTLAQRGLTVAGALGITFAKPAEKQRADAEQALALAAAGELVPRVHATFTLDRAPEAHVALEQRRTIGAVLLRP